jgi:signal transduction histidine kinase
MRPDGRARQGHGIAERPNGLSSAGPEEKRMNTIMCDEERPTTRRVTRIRRGAACQEQELRSLMTMTSHDLRSPLATIAAHLELLREDLGGQAGEELATIERSVRRMERLLDNLTGYARSADHEPQAENVALGDVVADVLAERVNRINGARITVDETLPTVRADRELLRHVLDNLVGNAIKYAAHGSTARAVISARTEAGAVRVEIADHGIGIPAGERPRVFDAFHRSSNSGGYPGTGLGLAICRRIVERHGGRIGVTGNPGGGSVFWFTLPTNTPA